VAARLRSFDGLSGFRGCTRPDRKATIPPAAAIQSVAFRGEDDALAQLRPEIDGVIFEYGHHRSIFLPQVWEDFRDPRVFLGHLKYKASLPPDFLDPKVKLSRYTVVKWSEADPQS